VAQSFFTPNYAYQAQSWTRPSNGGAQEQSANVGSHGSKEEGQHRIGRSEMDNFFEFIIFYILTNTENYFYKHYSEELTFSFHNVKYHFSSIGRRPTARLATFREYSNSILKLQ
jgi:hypothetical protein